MVAGGTIRRWRVVAVGVTLLAGAALATACEPQADAQPPVASVDFEPRLVVTVDDGGIGAATGPRDGAQIVEGTDTADWVAPAGSVLELRNDASGPRRILVTSSAVGSAEPGKGDVWLDTGDMLPGESVVLGLSATGEYGFALTTTGVPGEPELVVSVVPRPAV